ncbi:phenylalanyl-tRNA synthase subunit beta [Paenibacillus swuensis]|uniref:Phenylalanine--tRNA ligase beta subunit n=1 Tax=Paenibacillus swuensis TaxID=1178515 RepID=A0A172TGK8_9BACL|nr:phenylalanine--tRNA ligase subunit beta [Paenibacillus swuensis]ANE46171.1 phenylalanyl-tRNA synthase subunit beta [Paenibacillus swuensis]
MKVSYQWLSQYVDVSEFTASELAEKLTRNGIEVDFVEKRNKGVTGVVTGYVKTRDKHPDADKLSVVTVDVGGAEDLQIVCGAKNIDAGQKVPVAVVGAVLPDDFKIKKAKLRGVESQGMICSAKELGLNDKLLPKEIQEGILVLPENTPVGEDILKVLGINDEVMELDLTPNRSDALSMIGTAYEIAAIIGREIKLPQEEQGMLHSGVKAEERISVEITATEQCTHYAARLIENIQVGPSPLWMQNRLMAAGVRPINNVVDVTNYVMLEYGQPLHAFDADTLNNGHIDVRLANAGEKLTTLDGTERTLEPHMLLITDGVKPVALAGVMGGLETEVTAGTTRILLESAKFAGNSVRKTSRQLGLRSEASLRFEKEVNPEAVIPALNRAASLLAAHASGVVAEGIVEKKTAESQPVTLTIGLDRLNAYLGTELSSLEVKAILTRLHFTYEENNHEYTVHVPSRRGDITREVDLIEEFARLHGYTNIPTTLMNGVTTPGSLTHAQKVRRALREGLTGSGLHEVMTYSFGHPSAGERFPGLYGASRNITLAMPMNEERSTLRTSLMPHLLDVATYNRNRKTDDVAIFEIGNVYVTEEERLTRHPQEKPMLAMLWTGKRRASQWNSKAEAVDFYDLKGVFEKACESLGVEGLTFAAAQPAGFHPGRTAEIHVEGVNGDTLLGYIGQLHPELQKEQDLADTYVLEIGLESLYEASKGKIEYKGLPRYPSMGRDIAVVVNTEVQVGNLLTKVRDTAGELLESVQVFDIFTGERLGEGKKSVALALVYRHAERTLTDDEVSELHAKVVASLEQEFGAELRK